MAKPAKPAKDGKPADLGAPLDRERTLAGSTAEWRCGLIDGYIAKLAGEHRAICDALLALIQAAVPTATAELKWGMPMFSTTGMICYFRAQKEYVRFGFPAAGLVLPDPRGVLYGASDGKHVRLDRVADLDAKRMTGWIKAVATHVAAQQT